MEISNNYLIEVNHLRKVFESNNKKVQIDRLDKHDEDGVVVAVRDISFKIKSGEVFVIMGLSGSGKSTLIRCLTRLIEPSSGQIIINGKYVTAMTGHS